MGHPYSAGCAVVFVLLTAALSLAWSHYKLIRYEMYAFQHSVRSVSSRCSGQGL